MKALYIASIFALAATGTACSQTSDQDAQAQETEAKVETVAATEVDTSGFNLGLPTDLDAAGTTSTDGFNLTLPQASATSTDGFNLGTDLGASSGLAEIPEIGTSVSEDQSEETTEQATDDEPVIRLD